jgi:hypothetical protein
MSKDLKKYKSVDIEVRCSTLVFAPDIDHKHETKQDKSVMNKPVCLNGPIRTKRRN